MFDHLSITTTDLDRAQRFYDAVLGTLGIGRVNRRERSVGYGERRGIDGAPCYLSVYLTTGKLEGGRLVADNRHWCFRAPTRAAVRAFHASALKHGGTDDGPPGLRPQYDPDYYGAFVRDPDGNRIEAVTRQREDN